MNSKILIVMLKELRETLREKRTLALLIIVTLAYPVLIGWILHQAIDKSTRNEREGIELAVVGGAKVPTLMSQLRQKNVIIKDVEPMTEEAIGELLRGKKISAVLKVSDQFVDNYNAMRPARIELWFDSAAESNPQRRELEEILEAYGANVASARLLAHGVSPAALSPIQVQRYDTATNASRSAMLIGSIIGILFFPAFILNMSSAVDSTAGERERRSLEVLMAQPASTWQLVCGKWLASALPAIVGVTVALMLAHAILGWLPLEEIGMSWSLSWGELMAVCLVTAPLSLLSSALYIALAMNAKSFKEAQTTLSFVMLVPMLPGLIVPMLNLKTAQWMYMVPTLSNQTLIKELAKSSAVGVLPFVMTLLAALVPALLIVWFASWRMKSEKYVLAV